jgi:uncharacterized glyoxalase superfamily protein PhnB
MTDEANVTIQPVLHYADLEKAIAFLSEAFGFTPHAVHRDAEGQVGYAEMKLGDACIGIGPTSSGDSPFDLGPSAIYVSLNDPDAHHARAAAARAEIVMGLTDQSYGSREYAARDPEGNVWCFGTYRPGR